MAKLSDVQKNNIIAKWNTGEYTKTELAKVYKVSEKVIRNIVGKEEPTNAHIVEAQVMIEKVKKSEKSPNEIKAIEQAVKYRLEKEFKQDNNKLKIYDTVNSILEKVNETLLKGKAQKVVLEGYGKGMTASKVVDYDLQTEHLEKAMATVERGAKIWGVMQDKQGNTDLNPNNEVIIEIE